MIKRVTIHRFKGIEEGVVDGITQINLIMGRNNSGKSSFLEALHLMNSGVIDTEYEYALGNSIAKINRIINIRNQNAERLIYRYEGKSRITITYDNGEEGTFSLPKQELSGRDVSTALFDKIIFNNWANILGRTWERLKRYGRVQPIVDVISKSYNIPNLEDIEYVPSGHWLAMIRTNNTLSGYYLDQFGDGIKPALSLLALLYSTNPPVILIEDFENHQHPGALRELSEVLMQYAHKMNAQIFFATHSLDLVTSVISASKKVGLGSRIIFFRLEGGKLKAEALEAPSIEAVTDLGIDVRYRDMYTSS